MDELDTLAEKLYRSWRYATVEYKAQPAHTLPFAYSDLPDAMKLVWIRVAVDVKAMLPH